MTLTWFDPLTRLDAHISRCPSCGAWRWDTTCTLCARAAQAATLTDRTAA